MAYSGCCYDLCFGMFVGSFSKSSVNFVKIRRCGHAAVTLYLDDAELIVSVAGTERLTIQALQ
jgi:hypothetical protein